MYCNYCKTFPITESYENVNGTTFHCIICGLPLYFESTVPTKVSAIKEKYEEFFTELAGRLEVECDCSCGECHSIDKKRKDNEARLFELTLQMDSINGQIQEVLDQAEQLVQMKHSLEKVIKEIGGSN